MIRVILICLRISCVTVFEHDFSEKFTSVSEHIFKWTAELFFYFLCVLHKPVLDLARQLYDWLWPGLAFSPIDNRQLQRLENTNSRVYKHVAFW